MTTLADSRPKALAACRSGLWSVRQRIRSRLNRLGSDRASFMRRFAAILQCGFGPERREVIPIADQLASTLHNDSLRPRAAPSGGETDMPRLRQSAQQIKVMGDKSPKSNQKKSSQKQAKASSADQKKQQAAASKSAATKKK